MAKVLHVISGLSDGGAEASLYKLITNSPSIEHVVFTMKRGGKYEALLEKECVEVHTGNFSSIKSSVNSFLNLKKLVQQEEFVAFQAWMYHAEFLLTIICMLLKERRVFWSVHNTVLKFGESKLLTILLSYFNVVLSRVWPVKIIYCAEESQRIHENLGYSNSNSKVIQNGYDISRFSIYSEKKKKEIKENLGLEKNVVFGCVGRHDPYKDHANLISALNFFKEKFGDDFICLLLGKGMDNTNQIMHDLINYHGLNDNVLLCGPTEDIPKYMNVFDVHILSSSAEAFPNVICEAMACGTPCISTLVGDVESIVGDTGWLCPPKDPRILANCILEAVVERDINGKKFAERSLLARSRIEERFTIDVMVQSYLYSWDLI
ncbi:glycosyltransferase [Vibrio sp. VGrn 2]|uniref:glycosyltransferase n=1 Tax=Vibrio sp. VGrn 2 TaxID=2419839 RepID=UPI00128D12F2|nr:glycosyltransferase [Vibrio sp. VGrn 2]MPS38829.1 glycosyltransferase [Vibrio sp. VGrn 2]